MRRIGVLSGSAVDDQDNKASRHSSSGYRHQAALVQRHGARAGSKASPRRGADPLTRTAA
jgi:hypothetical protein